MDMTKQLEKLTAFKKLHSNFFILPNAWDAASAKTFEKCGFKAIGTTSAGIAVSHGYADRNMPFDRMLNTVRRIVQTVDIPVTVDMEDGYGQTPDEVAESVKQVIKAGATGINIEDSSMDRQAPLHDILLQQNKLAVIRGLGNAMGYPLFINARIDAYWIKSMPPAGRLGETIKRAHAYLEAGADCIFVPGIQEISDIQTLRHEISCPINVLAGPGMPSANELEALGIQRISTGSGPFRAAISLLHRMGHEILEEGTFEHMTLGVLSYDDLSEKQPW
ncbi:isocitrate lyase/phosphoenolpyruvate mutase family protein [Paenibacillus sp. JNUCC32]|uniref:isocitrate lyase/PEP mutase family protein n=1 Tax=Paenibacillus sp. JNUCC32 TaxID=2777984 RepID=UPI00178800E4|nr:isocitrate lyase/phosphoenolpyruvate mutase family protein [Paenibacillus sp. JNUCC-32]QOT12099.1 isocitrate lyase/phosphoenolpyruvate mutase family protein [Paenibacillus sp. JNUCC-32]